RESDRFTNRQAGLRTHDESRGEQCDEQEAVRLTQREHSKQPAASCNDDGLAPVAGSVREKCGNRPNDDPQKQGSSRDNTDFGRAQPAPVQPDREERELYAVQDEERREEQRQTQAEVASGRSGKAHGRRAAKRPLDESEVAPLSPSNRRMSPRIRVCNSADLPMQQQQQSYAQTSVDLEQEYRTIEAALLNTPRGRWFLAEHGRRARRLDSYMLEAAIEKLQKSIRQPPALLGQLRHEVEELRQFLSETR